MICSLEDKNKLLEQADTLEKLKKLYINEREDYKKRISRIEEIDVIIKDLSIEKNTLNPIFDSDMFGNRITNKMIKLILGEDCEIN